MDESCSTKYAYISCCIILIVNLIYLGFTSIKVFLQHRRRRQQRTPRRIPKMTENTNETTASRVTTRSSTAAAAAAAAASAAMTSASTITTTTTSATTSNRTTTTKIGYERLAQLYPLIGDELHLPSKWNSKEKPPSLALQNNDLVVTYKGPGKSHKDAASVRSDYPIPPLTGIYYFEVKILSKGRDGFMGIGLSTSEVNLNRLPGWDKGSYGYHGDDGHSFCSSGTGIVYGPTFTTDDIVGCCVNFLDNSCFYTRNGNNLGTSFRDIPADIYPTVGLQTPNESIQANFGLSPFMFDIDKYMSEYREKIRHSIMECTLKETELLHQTQLRRIVSTYLVHYGYCATAEQFNKNAESVYADELNSMRNRQLIQHLILDGRTTDAIDKTKELFPTLLNDKNLLFVLKVRQFIEMVNGTESEIRQSSASSSSSTSSDPAVTTTTVQNNNDNHSPSTTAKISSHSNSTERSSSPITRPNNSSRSRSNSPYTSGRTACGSSPHTNGANAATINPSARRYSGTTTTCELPQDKNSSEIPITSSEPTTVESTSTETTTTTSSPPIVNLMDIDDNPSGTTTNATNGYNHHTTVNENSSNNAISNGHSLLDDDTNNLVFDHSTNTNGYSTKSTDLLDGMDYDGTSESTHNMEMENSTISNIEQKTSNNENDQLLMRILQFGRELHALKQQLTTEHGENPYNDKILQDAFSLLAYSDPKSSPLAHLLEPSQRETVSSAVNSAILEAHDMPRHPALEVLVGYLNECDKLMRRNNMPDCAFIDLKKYLR